MYSQHITLSTFSLISLLTATFLWKARHSRLVLKVLLNPNRSFILMKYMPCRNMWLEVWTFVKRLSITVAGCHVLRATSEQTGDDVQFFRGRCHHLWTAQCSETDKSHGEAGSRVMPANAHLSRRFSAISWTGQSHFQLRTSSQVNNKNIKIILLLIIIHFI